MCGPSRRPSCNQSRSVSRGSKPSCSRCDSSKMSKLDGSAHSKRNSKHSPRGASQSANAQGIGTGRHSLRTATDSLHRTETLANLFHLVTHRPFSGSGASATDVHATIPGPLGKRHSPPLHHASSLPISLIALGSLGLLLTTKLGSLRLSSPRASPAFYRRCDVLRRPP